MGVYLINIFVYLLASYNLLTFWWDKLSWKWCFFYIFDEVSSFLLIFYLGKLFIFT